MQSPITVERLDDATQAVELSSFWKGLASTPLQSPEWLLTWWEHFRSINSQLCLLLVRRGNEPIGLAPFAIRNSWGFGRMVGFLGSGKACTDFQKLLCEPGEEETVADHVAAWFTSGPGRSMWDVIELESVQADARSVNHFVAQLRQQQSIIETTQLESTWRLDLTDGFAGVMARLSKTQRAQARNFQNRYDKNSEMSFNSIDTTSELAAGMESCIHLHQMRWQAVGKPGCFSEPRFTNFITNSFQELISQGQAILNLLEINKRPVASQLVLKDPRGNWYVYQTGRDPHMAQARVGQIINIIAIREACAAGAQFVDFLRGDEPYKPRIKAEPTAAYRIRAYAPALLPKIRYGAWKLTRELRAGANAVSQLFSKPQLSSADQLSS
jgi:CelD/BcsL family acetyltransferase involved in cellulose biosynthesis